MQQGFNPQRRKFEGGKSRPRSDKDCGNGLVLNVENSRAEKSRSNSDKDCGNGLVLNAENLKAGKAATRDKDRGKGLVLNAENSFEYE